MEQRQRYEALRAELRSAQTAYNAGDREKAIEHVDAALAIDPDFLGAHYLRERVLAPLDPVSPRFATNMAPLAPAGSVYPEGPVKGPRGPAEGLALFEQRARRLRVDRCIDAARTALQQRSPERAAAALEEVIELDPNQPELGQLTAELDELRRTAAGRLGPWIAAAAVFIITALGSWLPESGSLLAHPIAGSALLVSPPVPAAIMTSSTSAAATSELVAASVGIAGPLPQLTLLPRPEPGPAVNALALPAAAASIAMVNDELIIRQTLERYRNAYDGLDARSARRAFDGLQSQSFAFDACDIQVRGESATATCRGAASSVPKIGGRAPDSEPRAWSFRLNRAGDDWQIYAVIVTVPWDGNRRQ